jgi:hypothetical protein
LFGLSQNWIDAHFYNASTGFNMYWGAMGDSWAFGRIELPTNPSLMFDNISHSEYYATGSTRPSSYEVRGTSSTDGSTFEVMYEVPQGTYVLGPFKHIMFFVICDLGVREKDWRSRARGAKAM